MVTVQRAKAAIVERIPGRRSSRLCNEGETDHGETVPDAGETAQPTSVRHREAER